MYIYNNNICNSKKKKKAIIDMSVYGFFMG